MEHREFDDRDDWESWYAQNGPTSGPMPTAYESVPGYEFSGHQPGMRPGPWPQARQDYRYYARHDYRDYADEPAGAREPAPRRPGNGSGPANPSGGYSGWGTGYRADENNRGYGTDPYGTDPYAAGFYDNGSYGADPYNGGPYTTGAGADSGRPGVVVANTLSARRQPVARRPGDSVSAATRVLAAADQQAAAITQQASYRATMITQQVAYEAAETREAVRREADQIMQRAAVQASAVREAAETEAAGIRQAVEMMQTELSDLATRIAHTFPNPVLPRTPPAELPAASPAAQPPARPHASASERPATRHAAPPPATRPTARPAGKPGARPTAKPASGQGRQVTAMRFAVIATSALFLVAVVAGVAEIKLHGISFFVFRSVGSGETGPGGLQEDQGPGQPDAPKLTLSHSTARPILRPSITVHTG
jgi:hypothetical protein